MDPLQRGTWVAEGHCQPTVEEQGCPHKLARSSWGRALVPAVEGGVAGTRVGPLGGFLRGTNQAQEFKDRSVPFII